MSYYLYKYNYLLGFRIGLKQRRFIGDINRKYSLKLCSVLVIVIVKSNMVVTSIKSTGFGDHLGECRCYCE